MNLRGRRQVAGGWEVQVEVPNAFTDGTSRIDTIFVPSSAVANKTPEQIRHALQDALHDPFDAVGAVDIHAPITDTKALAEDRCEALYADWQRWSATYDVVNAMTDAQFAALSGLPGAGRAVAVSALLTRRNAALGDYLRALNAWRQAP